MTQPPPMKSIPMKTASSSRHLFSVIPMVLAIALLAGTSAHAERVEGRFTYQDYGDGVARPINDVKVEIWRYKPGLFGIWGWSMDRRVWTNWNGEISVDMPWAARGTVYALRVYASNAYVTVWPHDTAHVGESWYNEPPQQKAWNSSDVLNFTFNFDAWHAARNFNIARTLWFAGEYMTHRYAQLGKVNAQTTEMYSTFYDPAGDTIQMNIDRDFNDASIVHEYGHFVQEQIGSLPWEPTVHYVCNAYNTGLAWMEGFAGYFPLAVARAFPGELQTGLSYSVESGNSCSGTPADSVEYFVSATLWDLVDNGWENYSWSEPHDWTGDNDWVILSILDNELGAFGSRPTIWDFRNAWYARGMPGDALDSILRKHGILQ